MFGALADMLAIKNELTVWFTANNIDADFSAVAFEKKVRNLITLISGGIIAALISGKDGIIREAP